MASTDTSYDSLWHCFSELQTWRATFAQQWEEVAELLAPDYRNTFYFGTFNWPGQKKTGRQIDSTGMMANQRFGAICDSLLTPRNMRWHTLQTLDPVLRKDRAVRLWFEQVTNILFRYRYEPMAGFAGQNQQNYQQLGAFGTGAMFVDELETPDRKTHGLRYHAVPLGELFLVQNHQGVIDGFIRWFRLTPRAARQRWGDKLPPTVIEKAENNNQFPVDFLHWVRPNEAYEDGRLDAAGMAYRSTYASVEGQCIMQEGGYHTMPLAVSRYVQAPQEVYGRSPAMAVLPALKTLNAEKGVFLKQGHRAGDPVYLVADDGLMNVKLTPGAINPGGISPDGKPMIGILPTGQIQITETMMAEERNLINDSFLVSLFQILTQTPTMTATEVIERTNEKGILLAPTVGRQQDEYLGPLINRELDLLSRQHLLPPMPPQLREAGGEYAVTYTSPLAKAMHAQEAAGFMRTFEAVQDVIQLTQDPSVLDNFDLDKAVRAIADIQSVPESWMASPQAVAAKRQKRAEALAKQQQIQAAPAAAAMMKAQAVQAKAGMGQGGPPMPGNMQGAGNVPVGPQPLPGSIPGQ